VEQAQRFHHWAIRNNKQPLCPPPLTKNQQPEHPKQEKNSTCNNGSLANGDSRWTSITDRTLISLSRLVEPLRLFHPTRLSLTAIPQGAGHLEEFARFALLNAYSPQAAGNITPRDLLLFP